MLRLGTFIAEVSAALFQATGGSVKRVLTDRMGEIKNARDYGAVVDGATDDTTAVVAGLAASTPLVIPAGVSVLAGAASTLNGRTVGPGVLKTAGNKRPMLFARRSAPPTSYGDESYNDVAFNGDLGTVSLAIDHRIDGATTLGQPVSSYVMHHENAAATILGQNTSGWNQTNADATGRTGAAVVNIKVSQCGQGDYYGLMITGYANQPRATSTHFLANPAVLAIGGDLYGFADGNYVQATEIGLHDNGFDCAVSSDVRNFYRTNNTGAKSAWWIGLRYQSFGSKGCDVMLQPTGLWNNVLDTTGVTTGTAKAVMTLKADQRIYLNATNSDAYANPAATAPGTTYLDYNSTTQAVEVVVGGNSVLRAKSGGVVSSGSVALTSGATVSTDASLSSVFTLTLGISAALANPTNLAAGASYAWTIKQDATGSRLLTYGTAFKWPGGTVPTLSTAANATDLITAISDGTNLYAVLSKGFA